MSRTKRITASLAGLVLTATLSACADQGATPPAATTTPTSSTSATATASASASSDVATDHSEQDTTFSQMMIIHHEGAIEMSQLAIERAESPEVVAIAERIAEALSAGADDYVMKPFDSEILQSKFSEVGAV